jgi:iron complex transport system permease protein
MERKAEGTKMNRAKVTKDAPFGLGVKVEPIRLALISVSALLAASAVSVAGLIGFVGLCVPHITRLLIGSDYRKLVPACAINGGSVLVICDTISRIVMIPREIPVGIILAAIGAPFFLYLLRKQRRIA